MPADKIRTFYKYFPVGKRDRDWGLFVTTAGASQFGPGIDYPPAGHPKGYAFSASGGRSLSEYQLVYISAGQGWFKSKGNDRRKIEAGQVMLLFPGVWHSYGPSPATGWDEHWVGFNGSLARQLVRHGFFAPSQPILRAGDEEKLLVLFRDIMEASHNIRPALQQTLAAATMNILALLYSVQQSRLAGQEPGLQAVQKAVTRFREALETPLDIEALAAELKVSYRWFRRAFAHHTGLSPHRYLLDIRLARARQMLSHGSLSIKEIALRTGFEDANYFSRLFHKKMGVSAGIWRARAQKGRLS